MPMGTENFGMSYCIRDVKLNGYSYKYKEYKSKK